MSAPNVLLVILDSVRARNCSVYGHRNETTPELERLSERATLFEQARAPGIHSLASHVSIFSGYHVEQHGLHEYDAQIDPKQTIWHELSDDHGYETGLFTPNVIITETSNLDTSFDEVVGPDRRRYDDALAPADIPGAVDYLGYLKQSLEDDHPVRALLNGVYSKLFPRERTGETYVDEMLSWVDETDGPWAGCLNLMDGHYPYTPAPEYDRWGGGLLRDVQKQIPGESTNEYLADRPWGQLAALEGLYDGGIRHADAVVGQLVEELERRDLYDDTLLIVTSDHGEGFGERSFLTPAVRFIAHGWGIGEELTHVPLLVKEPGQDDGTSRRTPVSLTDVPAAIRRAVDGDSPVDAFISNDEPVLCSTFLQRPPADHLPLPEDEREPFFGPWRAIYESDGEYVEKHATRANDSLEMTIRDAQISYPEGPGDAERVAAAFDALDEVAVGVAGGGEVDEAVQERLADLGYLR